MRKRTKRKVWALVNPIQYAIEGVAYTPDDLLNKLRLGELAAIEAMRVGKASLYDWNLIKQMHGITETMAKEGIGPEALPACAVLQEELIEMAKRFEKMGRFVVTAKALTAMRDVYEFHDLQRQSVPRATYDRMIQLALARMKSRAPGTVEIM